MACSHYVSGAAKPVHWTGEPHAVVNLKLDFDAGLTVLTGAASSFLTVLLVMPGPPLMAYFMSQRQAPQAVRALSLTFFAVCYVLLALYHALATGYDRPALLLIALLSPVVIVATLFGSLFAERFSDGALRVALFTLLFLSGAGAIVSAAIS